MGEHLEHEFFPGQRRRLTLEDYTPLRNEQDEVRLRLDFTMPLTGQPVTGWPFFVTEAHDTAARLESGIPKVPITHKLEGVTIEFYPLPEAKRAEKLVTAATVRKLEVWRPEAGKNQDQVNLGFSITIKGSADMAAWAHANLGQTVFAQFTETEPTLKMEPAEEDKQLPLKPSNAGAKPEVVPAKAQKAKGRDGKSAAAHDNGTDDGAMPHLDPERQAAVKEGGSKPH